MLDRYSTCITVGTMPLGFPRIFDEMAAAESNPCFAQFGSSSIEHLKAVRQNIEFHQFVDERKLIAAMAASDVVVVHAGMGSILKANGLGKKILVVPRISALGEHYDDHQLQISKYLIGQPGIEVTFPGENDFIQKYRKIKEYSGEVPQLMDPRAMQQKILQILS